MKVRKEFLQLTASRAYMGYLLKYPAQKMTQVPLCMPQLMQRKQIKQGFSNDFPIWNTRILIWTSPQFPHPLPRSGINHLPKFSSHNELSFSFSSPLRSFLDNMPAESPQFGCFTLQQASPATIVFLSDVGQDGQPARKRKVHTKSRLGCAGCKARRVKVWWLHITLPWTPGDSSHSAMRNSHVAAA
jgi:hypothetical protein